VIRRALVLLGLVAGIGMLHPVLGQAVHGASPRAVRRDAASLPSGGRAGSLSVCTNKRTQDGVIVGRVLRHIGANKSATVR
jgi:hypothetical protein